MYWLYERPNRELIAHHQGCSRGCHGRGQCRHASGKSDRWHPCDTIEELAWKAIDLKSDFRWCCFCRRADTDRERYLHLLDVGLVAFVEEGLERA